MDISTYITRQYKNLNGVLHHLVGDLTEEEWISRPGPGQNTLGYTVWHIPRMHDHFLKTWILNQPEVIEMDHWSHWRHLRPMGIGVGITLKDSDEIARTTTLADTLKYADEVHEVLLAWLAGIDGNTLDIIPAAKEHLQAFPQYQTPGYQEETNDLLGLPIWGLLIRPCMGHVHRHLGELEITKDVLRKAK
jgi:hypothetical protein